MEGVKAADPEPPDPSEAADPPQLPQLPAEVPVEDSEEQRKTRAKKIPTTVSREEFSAHMLTH